MSGSRRVGSGSSAGSNGSVMRYWWAIGMMGTVTPTSLATSRAVGQCEGQLAGVEVSVARQERRALHAVRGDQREALLGLGRADDLEREPERLGPAGLALDLLHPRL